MKKAREEMGIAIEDCFKKIKGADHDQPAWHYRLAEGKAYEDQANAWDKTATITPEIASKAEYTFNLCWIKGVTCAIFQLGDRTFAQPTTKDGKANLTKMKHKEEKSIVQQLKEVKAKEADRVGTPQQQAEEVSAAPKGKPQAAAVPARVAGRTAKSANHQGGVGGSVARGGAVREAKPTPSSKMIKPKKAEKPKRVRSMELL